MANNQEKKKKNWIKKLQSSTNTRNPLFVTTQPWKKNFEGYCKQVPGCARYLNKL